MKGPVHAPSHAATADVASLGAVTGSSDLCSRGDGASRAVSPDHVLRLMEAGWYGDVVGKAVKQGEAPKGRLLARKRSPSLTWWLEGARAVGAVMLLPLLACTPFRTSIQQQPPG